ncbi:dihydroorotase family protein [Acidaminobacter sp. JC074]|uniref:dihydroorotase n=1 Tax=Acidaminobacter sp. JC074 TaxID=2530199 RepID=UPI001F0CF7CD|nr:amidohydrolase family protein [Acidaminobacter sp. JC074]
MRIIHGQCYIDHEFIETNIYIKSGKISKITKDLLDADKTIDADGLKVLPGFIDPHVHLHLNIGKTFSADDFKSGSQSAALGGVTTLLDFLDPIYDNSEFETVFKRRLQEAENAIVDYGFHCTFANYKDDYASLLPMLKEAGITSVKVFTTYSDSDRKCSYEKIKEILSEDLVMMAHSENDDRIKACESMSDYEASRSEEAEYEAVDKLLKLKSDKGRLYIVHISSGHTLDRLDRYKDVYYESCPQYFYLSKDLFLKEDGKKYLLAPPIRSHDSINLMKDNSDKLDTIGTDHCPFMLDEKLVDEPVDKIPKGLGSLGYAFQLLYTLYGDKIIPKFTENTAEIFGLSGKGYIKKDFDADLVLLEEGDYQLINPYTKCDFNVYEDIKVNCQIKTTISRGRVIMENGQVFDHKGKYLRRAYEGNR